MDSEFYGLRTVFWNLVSHRFQQQRILNTDSAGEIKCCPQELLFSRVVLSKA